MWKLGKGVQLCLVFVSGFKADTGLNVSWYFGFCLSNFQNAWELKLECMGIKILSIAAPPPAPPPAMRAVLKKWNLNYPTSSKVKIFSQ